LFGPWWGRRGGSGRRRGEECCFCLSLSICVFTINARGLVSHSGTVWLKIKSQWIRSKLKVNFPL
jgi:hypothetical protein